MTALVALFAWVSIGAVGGLVALGLRGRRLGREVDRLTGEVAVLEARQLETERMRARLAASLGAMADGVVIFGEDGVSVYHNDPAAIYLDARHGDALVEEAITGMVGTVAPGEVRERELEVFGPPRRTLVVRAISLAAAGGGGAGDRGAARAGVLVVVEDVTERRRLENVRRDFVANISHELKTPVGALALLAETLVGEEEPVVVRRLAERMVGEAFRVARTIEDLSELSRLEVDPGRLAEPVAVATVVEEAVDRVRPAADRRGITVRVRRSPDDLRVEGDRRQLVSALANLLDNAVKYSDPGSPVEVDARASSRWVEVEVRDYGIGIPRRELERIFERFYRVDRARSRETGGTGLGLAIVRHVAANHRGEVLVDSREGEGSRFTLRLAVGDHDESDAPGPSPGDAIGSNTPHDEETPG